MSLILEALKKSERQRRLGESPSLGSPVMVTRRRRSLLPVLAVLIVIGAVAMWWVRHESEQPPPTETASTAAPSPASAPTPAPAESKPSQPSRVADGTTFNDAPVAASTTKVPPSAQAVRQPPTRIAANAEGERSRKIRDGELVAANPQAGPAATIKESEPVSAADPVALAAAMASTEKPVAGPVKPPTEKQPDRVDDRKGVKPAAPPSPPLANVAGSPLKLMWELPLATRSKLPEIKLSMHVFAVEPTQRFAIINDERRAEGDDVDGMKLIEIRTDGVVFEFDNVRFLYPRGGR